MATTVRGVLVCVAAMLLISGCWITVNADDNVAATDMPTAKPTTKPTTASITTRAITTGKGTTQTVKVTTGKVTTGPNTGTAMPTTFDTPEIVTDNGTTATGMVTTGMVTTETTPPLPGEWNITDSSGAVCMKIRFSGTFSVGDNTIVIPRDGITTASKCLEDKSLFNLVDAKKDPTVNITMVFELDGDTYEMNNIYFSLTDVQPTLISYYNGDHAKEYFEAPVGKFYKCDKDMQDAFHLKETVTLTLSDQKYQPFAKKSGQGYGKEFNCGDKLPEDHGPRVGLIVSMILLALLVVACCGFFVYRRKKSSYQRFNNGV